MRTPKCTSSSFSLQYALATEIITSPAASVTSLHLIRQPLPWPLACWRHMAFIPAGDTDKLFLAFVIITLFLYWRNWESVSKLGAIRKKTRRLLFEIEKGNKSKESKCLFLLALAIARQLHKLNKMCSLLLNAYKIYTLAQKQQSHTRLRMQWKKVYWFNWALFFYWQTRYLLSFQNLILSTFSFVCFFPLSVNTAVGKFNYIRKF